MKGYDYYFIDNDIHEFLDYIQIHQIQIYRLKKNDHYTFYSTYKYRKSLNENPHIYYKYTVGIIGMLFRLNIEKVISLLLSSILLFGLSNTIFEVEIIGESIKHKHKIQDKLLKYKIPFFYNEKSITNDLDELNSDLNWYEIIREGSNLQIHYLPRYLEINDENQTFNLIAEKQGVIAKIDVRKGNVIVHLNQKVNKGDLLVSNLTIDSQMNEKNTDVIGKVYAYTFKRVDVSINRKFPIGIGYYLCLLKSRMEIELDDGEKIIKEISLHFREDFDTIRMSNYYVLYEEISKVGD